MHVVCIVFISIGLFTGISNNLQMYLPYEWQPKIVATQVALIGNVVIAGVPGEFTTMSGRRLREAIKTVMNDASDDETSVIVAGLCNTYSDYVTTPEEYQVNRRPHAHYFVHYFLPTFL